MKNGQRKVKLNYILHELPEDDFIKIIPLHKINKKFQVMRMKFNGETQEYDEGEYVNCITLEWGLRELAILIKESAGGGNG